ncbi:fbxl-1 [Pristionchus pacificus]|nr:fbxl-1 [Pristionchus pacificus]
MMEPTTSTSATRRKRPSGQMISAKQNQTYLITSLVPYEDGSLINKTLPKELILRIFSYLDIISLCRSAQTCRLWSSLALDGINWQSIDLFTFQKHVKSNVLDGIARRCGGFLKELSLKGCENIHDSALRSFTAKCANIEYLSLHKCKRVTDTTCDNLGRHCHKLLTLNLDNCTAITDRSLRSIADGCRMLETLNISWCDNVTDRGIQMLLQGCPLLSTLILKGCEGLTERVFEGVESNLKELRVLNMHQCYVTDITVTCLAEGAHNLQSLNLANCNLISDASLQALAKGCKQLVTLELAHCTPLSDSGFTHLGRSCTKLERIDLEDCINITDSSVICFSMNCPNLANLGLSHCELLTDASITALIANQREILEVLELDNCPNISDAGLSQLKVCPKLRRLDLYDCQNVSKDAVCRFRSQRPGVEVHAYFAPLTPPAAAAHGRQGGPICRCCNIL